MELTAVLSLVIGTAVVLLVPAVVWSVGRNTRGRH